MIPLRLTFMLIGVLFLALFAFANPEPVTVRLIFWTQEYELYKIIFISALFGAIMAILYIGHVRYVRRSKDRYRE